MQKICKQVKIACISSGQTFAYLLLTKIYTSPKEKKMEISAKNIIKFGINLVTKLLWGCSKVKVGSIQNPFEKLCSELFQMQNCTLFSYNSHLCIMHWINRVTLLSCWMISKILFNMDIPNKTWLIGRGFWQAPHQFIWSCSFNEENIITYLQVLGLLVYAYV